METQDTRHRETLTSGRGNSFYQLLHMMGLLPPDAPATLRMLNPRFQGQLTTAELIGQYDLACIPVRDLLIGYLDERQPSVDYATLHVLARSLGRLFWKDLETHNPGISSLRLAPDVAVAWKQRLAVRTVSSRDAAGNTTVTTTERLSTASVLTAVRAFYLDIAEWAGEDPARWAQWAVPSPVRKEDIQPAKAAGRRKSRMDQRTRERIPVLPALVTAVDQARKDTAAQLAAATAAAPGDLFTVGGITLRKTVLTSTWGRSSSRAWAEDPVTGTRRDLTREENTAFWTWAAVEVLRATGIRIEELIELSHHSLVQYRLPSTGELVPLLHIAPSKADVERLLVISPELATCSPPSSPASGTPPEPSPLSSPMTSTSASSPRRCPSCSSTASAPTAAPSAPRRSATGSPARWKAPASPTPPASPSLSSPTIFEESSRPTRS